MNLIFRQKMGQQIWYLCTDCDDWPVDHFVEIETDAPPAGTICHVCTERQGDENREADRDTDDMLLHPASGRPAKPEGIAKGKSALEEEFHLHARELDDIVILERVRRRADLLAVHRRSIRAFDVSKEIALRAPR